ncbi:Partitioning defective 6 beta [Liparis tanakae]|uniref:Partitioning defective 6 beta n=1 Tax=Liparis tanakae TaxID=230148 RepID=A0A4Z2EJ96_9TELE|nr:Partitioning defective 6 beta [Liparis tanakae]
MSPFRISKEGSQGAERVVLLSPDPAGVSLSNTWNPKLLQMVRLCHHVGFGAEFRRFSLDRSKPGRFDEFYGLLQHVHRIPNVELLVGYADVHGDLLPINNDDNYHKAISTASPLLRLFLQRKGKQRGESGGVRSFRPVDFLMGFLPSP